MKPSERPIRHWFSLLGLCLLTASRVAVADPLAVESLRLGRLPGTQASIWTDQGLGELKAGQGLTMETGASAAAMARESGGKMAQWDNSPRGQSNEWRVMLLETVERHEAKARTETNAVMHRMIALQTLAEFAERFPKDRLLPEVLLHQSLLLRDSGLPVLALDKSYSALRALPLSGSADFRYLRRLTLITQGTIADLNAEIGRIAAAADLYGRLIDSGLQQNPPGVISVRRLRLLEQSGNEVLLASLAKSLLQERLQPAEEAEVRGLLALASLRNGDVREAELQTQIVLEAHRRSAAAERPVWDTWRLRLGNAAANHLFRKGAYAEAKVIYESIAEEMPQPAWRWQATGMVARCDEATGRLQAAHGVLLRRVGTRPADPSPSPASGVSESQNLNPRSLRNASDFHTASVGRQAVLEADLTRALTENPGTPNALQP
jgi:hypothetical protein